MTELLTAAQMKAIEQAAIDSGKVTGLELMERAGRGVVEAVFEEWPELAKSSYRAVVLCGPGNNGGDGFVVARLLAEWGWEVEVFLYGNADKLPPDARVNYERWMEIGEVALLGFPVVRAEAFEALWGSVHDQGYGVSRVYQGRPELVIDAIFGTGLSRPAWGISAIFELYTVGESSRWDGSTRWVAIDVPSGLCADSGKKYAPKAPNTRIDQVLAADLTVSFHLKKLGHQLGDGSIDCGRVVVKPIGLPKLDEDELDNLLIDAGVHETAYMTGFCQSTPKVHGHKFSHGHALILSGSSGKTGAARLAARGALRIGAGVVTVGCPPDAVVENAAQLNAIMLEAVQGAEALARILQDTRINALCLGPALGKGARELELVRVALEAKRPLVLDADALSNRFFDETDALFGKLHDQVVLTPHAGEFARMFPDIAEKLNAPASTGPAYSKVDATREAAKRAGCVVLFKGADTVIADADGRAAINSAHYDRAAPWLATAGSGDVLAGFITGLLARGFAPMQAAETAAWLHVECALSFGAGLIAEDLPDILPKVFKGLGV